jgi:hypothetical protein
LNEVSDVGGAADFTGVSDGIDEHVGVDCPAWCGVAGETGGPGIVEDFISVIKGRVEDGITLVSDIKHLDNGSGDGGSIVLLCY